MYDLDFLMIINIWGEKLAMKLGAEHNCCHLSESFLSSTYQFWCDIWGFLNFFSAKSSPSSPTFYFILIFSSLLSLVFLFSIFFYYSFRFSQAIDRFWTALLSWQSHSCGKQKLVLSMLRVRVADSRCVCICNCT